MLLKLSLRRTLENYSIDDLKVKTGKELVWHNDKAKHLQKIKWNINTSVMNATKIVQPKYFFYEAMVAAEKEQPVVREFKTYTAKRVESIDLLRGVVMIIMALDHVRDYFSRDAFLYDPADLTQTNPSLFFTRFITHYCAPVFVFLSGISAYLYGLKKSKKELSVFLLTRGIWLVFAELFIVSLFRTFNFSYTYVNLQVIWAIGVCMMLLSAIIYLPLRVILISGIILIGAHNMLDTVHVAGNTISSFLWSVLHDAKHFSFGSFIVYVHYPFLPWLGVMMLGYAAGNLYRSSYKPAKRKTILLWTGVGATMLFFLLRAGNWYGDAVKWSVQKNAVFTILSFFNVTKYPPSLLYILITLGPALLFLAYAEKPLNAVAQKIATFGRVPMFYYLAHILLIHILAIAAALITGYPSMVVLHNSVNATPQLKGYGFNLFIVYMVWVALIFLLYPWCKRFDQYKRKNQSHQKWLSYL